jgi:adenylate cyclase
MADLDVLPAGRSSLMRGSIAQKLRILSGLVLFTFVFFHLSNHALGIWSIEAMDAMQAWRTAVTRSVTGTIVLASALTVHMALNLTKIARRSTWRMPIWEATQIGLGLLIPVLLFRHGSIMRAHFDLEGSATRYSETLPDLWNSLQVNQFALVLIVWTHACIGLHYWLRLSRNYRRIAPALLGVAVLLPALALSGFTVGARQAIATASAEDAGYGYSAAPAARSAGSGYGGYDTYRSGGDYGGYGGSDDHGGYGQSAAAPAFTADDVQAYATWTAWGLLGAVAATLAFRGVLSRRRRRVRVSYNAGPAVQAPIGPTLLEISRMFGVPHTSVCGGRARCSTCRVRVESADPLPPRTSAEAKTLQHIGAGPDIRLACQVRPNNDVNVTRLIRPPEVRRPSFAAAGHGIDEEEAGVERVLAILFLDIRGFTSLSEARLPYDTVFLLNRFFAEVGEAINAPGGWIDKYLGDGLLALFGVNRPVEEACRSALVAAVQIDAALERLNHELKEELSSPLRIGIGLHVGPLILGRIGHRASASTTVIGPAVNVASRLEVLTKEHGVQVIASAELVEKAGVPAASFQRSDVIVRGGSTATSVVLIPLGRHLAPHLDRSENRSAA